MYKKVRKFKNIFHKCIDKYKNDVIMTVRKEKKGIKAENINKEGRPPEI